MALTRTSSLKIIKVASAAIVIIIIAAYALWRSFTYARGPAITLTEPSNFATITSTTTHVIGRVERANSITLNGKAITIDEQGHFDETILVFPGTNILTLVARDQFERSVETRVEVVRK
jgi:hypothetical protein